MIDFGYTINKSSRIDLDKNPKDIADRVSEMEPTFKQCIGCGSCTATCSAANFMPNFNFRKIQLLVNRGELKDIKQSLQNCMLCGKCMLVCPRGINTRNVIKQLYKALQ